MLTFDILLFVIISVVLGLISIFYGYQIFKIFLMLVGFVLGVWVVQNYFPQANSEMTLLVSLVSGVVGALLANFLYSVGFVVSAGFLSAGFAALAINYISPDIQPMVGLVLMLIAGVTGALLVLLFNLKKLMLVILTVLYGMYLLMLGALSLIYAGNPPALALLPQATSLGLLLIVGIVGATGFFKQMNDRLI